MIGRDRWGEEVEEGREREEKWEEEYPSFRPVEDEGSEETGDEYREESIE